MAAVGALLEGPLAPFLARHMEDLLPLLLNPAMLRTGNASASSLEPQAAKLRQMIATQIPPRLLLSTLPPQVATALDHGQRSLEALLGMVSVMLDHLDSATAAMYSQELFTLLLGLMDLRRQRHKGIPRQDELDNAVMRYVGRA